MGRVQQQVRQGARGGPGWRLEGWCGGWCGGGRWAGSSLLGVGRLDGRCHALSRHACAGGSQGEHTGPEGVGGTGAGAAGCLCRHYSSNAHVPPLPLVTIPFWFSPSSQVTVTTTTCPLRQLEGSTK